MNSRTRHALLKIMLSLGALLLPNSIPAKADAFRFVSGPGYLDLFYGTTPVYRHMNAFNPAQLAETFKVFHHVYGFHGEGFITKGSEGSYPHHRGISLAWISATANGRTTDTWQGMGAEGWQKHNRYLPERELITLNLARNASVTDWMDSTGFVMVHDTREVVAQLPIPGKLQLDFYMTIESAVGTLTLSGNAHHAGFQFRGIDSPTPMEFMLPTNVDSLIDETYALKTTSAWAMAFYSVKSNPYAVLIMDHPSNPRPLELGKRAYGRFGFEFSAQIPFNKPLKLAYRMIVFDRIKFPSLTREELQTLYTAYSLSSPVGLHSQRTEPKKVTTKKKPHLLQINGRAVRKAL